MTKKELKVVFVNGAKTIIGYLKEGRDGFWCRKVIEKALIVQGKCMGLDKKFPKAFADLKGYYPIDNYVGLIMVLEKFIETLESE